MKLPEKSLALAVAISVMVLIMGAVGYLVIKGAESSRSDIPVLGEVPAFDFIDSSNRHFGNNELHGKINVIDFFFTSCRGPCPIMSANMAELYQLFKDEKRIRFVSSSVDPEIDTPVILRDYASNFGVMDDRWIFLNGAIENVVLLSEQGFHLAAEGLPSMHSTKFILVDDKGRIRGYYSGTDDSSIKILIRDIHQLYHQLQ